MFIGRACNRYGGQFSAEDGELTISGMESTMTICTATGMMDLEQAYSDALRAAERYEIADGLLTITHADGTITLAPLLTGTSWRLISLAGEDVIGEEPLTLIFGEDGQLSGHAGCNTFNTGYTRDGTTLSIAAEIMMTRRACMDEAINDQEMAYVNALPRVTTYRRAGDRLTLTTDTGAELVYVRQSDE
jgi:heat shock protein HslJ